MIAELRAALDEDERAIDAYEAHRAAGGQCINFTGQDPADYSEFDSCSIHMATAEACRYRDMDFGLRQVAAIRKVLDYWSLANAERLKGGEVTAQAWMMDRVVLALAAPYGIEP